MRGDKRKANDELAGERADANSSGVTKTRASRRRWSAAGSLGPFSAIGGADRRNGILAAFPYRSTIATRRTSP